MGDHGLANVGLARVLAGGGNVQPEARLLMNEAVVRAVGHGLQVVDGVEEGRRLDVASVRDVAPDRRELKGLLRPFSSRKNGGLVPTPWRPGRAIRLNPFPIHRPGRLCNRPRSGLAGAADAEARKKSVASGMVWSPSVFRLAGIGIPARHGTYRITACHNAPPRAYGQLLCGRDATPSRR